MKAAFTIISLIVAAAAVPAPVLAPAPTFEVCGPTSNCELVERDGRTSYEFKRGMGPGSEDFKRRFAHHDDTDLSARDDEVHSLITLGRTKLDWGCDASVFNAVAGAMEDLCNKAGGGCDEGRSHDLTVQYPGYGWTGRNFDKTLKIKVEGTYKDETGFNNLYQGILKTINYDTTSVREITWTGPRTREGQNTGRCNMKEFPNFVRLTRYVGESIKDDMKFIAEVEGSKAECLAPKLLSAIGGSFNGALGGFFGVVEAICDQKSS